MITIDSNYTKEILKEVEYGIFISGANLLEIKKSQKLLEIYTKEWNIYNKKIKIIKFQQCKSIYSDLRKNNYSVFTNKISD